MNDTGEFKDSSLLSESVNDDTYEVNDADAAPIVSPPKLEYDQRDARLRRVSEHSASDRRGSSTSQRRASSRRADRREIPKGLNYKDGGFDAAARVEHIKKNLIIPGMESIATKKNENRNSIAIGSPTSADLDTQDDSVTRASHRNRDSSNQPLEQAEITYKSRNGNIKRVTLRDKDVTIGRKLESDISLHCPKVSKLHAVVKRVDGEYAIIDMNSTNGIRINDRHIPQSAPIVLKNDDKISIGPYTLSFKGSISTGAVEGHRLEESYLNNEQDNADDAPDAVDGKPQRKYGDAKVYKESNRKSQKTRSILNSNKKKTATDDNHRYTRLVTILPSEKKYEGSVTIKAEIPAEPDTEFKPFSEVSSMETIQEDYEKLRLAYELSKSFSLDITEALSKSCEIMFEILPLDRAVVLLVDNETRMLVTHYVRVRKGGLYSQREIRLSSTILRKVYHSRKALITSDAFEDPILNRHASVKHGQIRSVICVPLMTRDKVLGVLHLDSRNKIANLSKKDLSLVIAVGSQTALAIENSILVKEVEHKARLTEQFSRFLPPYVVDKMTKNRGEGIPKGGRDTFGTIVFSDIRGFTSLSERTVPSEVVNLLNDYFERLVSIVFKYNGVVDKYIGDALMAAFGTMEHECLDSEFRAVSAALEFKKAIEEMNMERVKINREPIAIGIGLNTGELLAGFIGCSQRLEYTCIGDTVNTSSRICSMAGVNQVLMSQSTWEVVKDRVVSIPVGYRQFKGKDKEVMVYEPIYIKKS